MTMMNKIKTWFTQNTSEFSFNHHHHSNPVLQSHNHSISMALSEIALSLLDKIEPTSPNHQANSYVHLDDEYEIDLPNLSQAMEFSDAMLEKTLHAHQVCLDSLENALRGKNPKIYQEHILNDDRCRLGNWLYDNQKVFSHYAEYTLLMDAHQAFHDCVYEVLSYHREGQFLDAMLLFKKDLLILSKQTKEALIDLYREVQKNSNA